MCSQRRSGRFTGDILIVTDHADAMRSVLDQYNVTYVSVPPVPSLRRVWFTKCKLLELVPARYRSVLYLDSDVMTVAPLDDFFASIPALPKGSIGMFSDATTRYGWAGGERYHAGVLLMQRNASESCLAAWCDCMLGHPARDGRAPESVNGAEDDQISMLSVVEENGCTIWFPADRHMQFMSDAGAMLALRPSTFIHFTRTARSRLLGRLRWFWRWLVFTPARAGGQCAVQAQAAYTPAPRPVEMGVVWDGMRSSGTS